MSVWPYVLLPSAVLLALFLIAAIRLRGLLLKQPVGKRRSVAWEDKGSTPGAAERYAPQGLTWFKGRLLFANTWNNRRSRVYRIEPISMRVEQHFDMPAEAVHTSGLATDGEYIWAVDHISNRAYKIDAEESFRTGLACVLGTFDTTLRGTSAGCVLVWDGKKVLAVSDFMHTKETLFIDCEEALAEGSARGSVLFRYSNDGFSQGLAYDGRYLYESENKLPRAVVNRIDVEMLSRTTSSREATVMQYLAPARGIEDIAWDGACLWTSDETTFRFYKDKLE